MFHTGIDPITYRPTRQRAPNGAFWPRGFRNGNPGNIDFNPANKWQGQVGLETRDPNGPGFKPRFAVFQSAAWGARALLLLLITYQDRHGLNTIRGIIGRWAPTNENDTGAYVREVAKATGFGPDQEIDLHFAEDALPIARAICRHELGDPRKFDLAEWYPAAMWTRAATLAGLQRRAPRPVGQDRELVASGTATVLAGVSLADGTGMARQFIEPGSVAAQLAGVLAVVVVAYLLARALRRRKQEVA
jgi:hypothetical protein